MLARTWLPMRTTIAFQLSAAFVVALACGGGSNGTGGETSTSTTNPGTSSESSTSTTVTPTTEPPETTETSDGPPCPFYGYEQLPAGNVGTAYDWMPEPTDEPNFWEVRYDAIVPGLEFGATITGVPEEEGRFMVTATLASDNGGTCQTEIRTLVIGPPLPGDTSGTETGTGGSETSGSSDDSGSTGDGSSTSGSTTGE